jgi:hypothetical protein
MTPRQKRLIILGGILLIILLLILLLFLRSSVSEQPEVIEPVTEIPVSDERVTETPIEKQKAEEREITSNVQTLGKTFTERYGSYSNEAEFQNLRDLYPLMTQEFVAETERFIDETTIPENYYGVTTRVITVTVDEHDEEAGVASLTINTQREEAIDSPQNVNVRYQEIVVDFEFVSGTWMISNAQWK